MTKITHLAYNRKFEKKDIAPGISDMERREKTIPSYTKSIGMCFICNQPVMGAPGQLLKKTDGGLYSHKLCRKRK